MWTAKHREEGLKADDPSPTTGRALPTMDRRLLGPPGGAVAPVYNAAYSAAFALDPFFADVEQMTHGSFCCAPMLQESHMTAAQSIVERVDGKAALSQFCCLFSQGYPKSMQQVVAGLAQQRKCEGVGCSNSSKRNRDEVPTAADRLRVWRRFGGQLPEL
jgi:hypothetical protein